MAEGPARRPSFAKTTQGVLRPGGVALARGCPRIVARRQQRVRWKHGPRSSPRRQVGDLCVVLRPTTVCGRTRDVGVPRLDMDSSVHASLRCENRLHPTARVRRGLAGSTTRTTSNQDDFGRSAAVYSFGFALLAGLAQLAVARPATSMPSRTVKRGHWLAPGLRVGVHPLAALSRGWPCRRSAPAPIRSAAMTSWKRNPGPAASGRSCPWRSSGAHP